VDTRAPDLSFGKWPWCDICNIPCSTVTWTDEGLRRRVRVECAKHGGVEEQWLPFSAFQNGNVRFGWAFTADNCAAGALEASAGSAA